MIIFDEAAPLLPPETWDYIEGLRSMRNFKVQVLDERDKVIFHTEIDGGLVRLNAKAPQARVGYVFSELHPYILAYLDILRDERDAQRERTFGKAVTNG